MRKPRIFSVSPNHGERGDASTVDVGITYEGLKNATADMMHLDPDEAVSLATELLVAAGQAKRANK